MNRFYVFAVALGLYFAGWQLLSPPFVVSDEPWHATRAYSAIRFHPLLGTPWFKRHSDWVGGPLHAPAYIFGRSIRQPTVPDRFCFTHIKTIPATCAVYDWNDQTPTDDPNPTSDYPPVGYLWAGLPTLFLSGAAAYYGMRLMMFLGVLLPILIAARSARKDLSQFAFTFFILCLPPSIVFHTISVSLDGTIFGCVIATALLLAAGLKNPKFLNTRANFLWLVLFSSLSVLLKSTAAATIGLMLLVAFLLKMPQIKRWVKWLLPAYFIATILFVVFPFAFPLTTLGLKPGVSLVVKSLGTLAALLDEMWTVTVMGDFQIARLPIAFALPYVAWAVYVVGTLWSKLEKVQRRALSLFISLLFLFALTTSIAVADHWFAPWQARYGWPGMISGLILIASFSKEELTQHLPMRVGYWSWALLLLAATVTAYNRFYQGIVVPEQGDWWTSAVGFVGRNESSVPPIVYFAVLALLGCAITMSQLISGRSR